jgi:CHASE2 domain-containing sensor protein
LGEYGVTKNAEDGQTQNNHYKPPNNFESPTNSKLKARAENKKILLISFWGAGLSIFCGLVLWGTPIGDFWVNASYDNLFRFGSHALTNQVSLILMDNASFAQFHQSRSQPWDRALHAQLLNRLADDGCQLVVLDSFFGELREPAKDEALAAAMRRQKKIVLMAELSQVTHPELFGGHPTLPAELFLQAAKTNWGVAWLDPDPDSVVRRQWPYPSPGPYPSLPWSAAKLTNDGLGKNPQERWVRYYGQHGCWKRMSYGYALAQPANYFRNQTVFIGSQPETSRPDGEADKFGTPYTRWTDETSGGVEILLASYLNLADNDSLVRLPGWVEISLLALAGVILGGGLCWLRRTSAFIVVVGIFVVLSLAAILASYYTNYWFPWLIIGGGQLPCAMAWSLIAGVRFRPVAAAGEVMELPPVTPGFELVRAPFAEGAYGKVWLARNPAGQWVALKVVYQKKFGDDPAPYEREFNGVQKYKSVCAKHPGLLQVHFVSGKKTDYFFYAMELGDSIEPGWEQAPAIYKPRALVGEGSLLRSSRVPVKDCIHVAIILCEALEFLHQQGMAHRDIKPQNIIFIKGKPKLADLGLITEIRPHDQERTIVGTPGYMPPPPERPGTAAADIYALGMMLYVLSTGRPTRYFPEVATTLANADGPPEFLSLSLVILQACQPLPADRYASAAQMGSALKRALKTIERFGKKAL